MSNDDKKSRYDHAARLRNYNDGASVDAEVFAEQRSNTLLYSGEHYNKRMSNYYKRVRDSKELSTEQKLRITKNHIQYISDAYANNIISTNIGVGFSPHNEKEPHDQKISQMDHAIWRDAVNKYNVDSKIDDWVDNFVQHGEVFLKIYFDPSKGKIKAYNQKTNDQGDPIYLDSNGQETKFDGSEIGMQHIPAQDEESPINAGEFCWETIYGFNVIRPPECKDFEQAEYLTIRSMVSQKELLAKFPDKKDVLVAGQDETYMVFDSVRGGYTRMKDHVLLLETYYKPCNDYPNGYFYWYTKNGDVTEGELPGGEFPIKQALFKKFATTPRGRSPIKTMRPYQAEINRSGSKTAEHQITLGDDKLLIQNGTKVSAGASLPGIRSVNYTGMQPGILQGRDGSQYLNYQNSQITELYQVMGVREMIEDDQAQMDPYVMLFKSASQKKKFQRYIKRFERFLIEVVKLYIKLAKVHLTDDYVVKAVGSSERVNIPEFRSNEEMCYEVNIEAQSDDIETKLGKQLVLNHALQYIGSQLNSNDLGKILRQMPYANLDETFSDLTLDYDNSLNDILALDRGETPPVNQYDDHVYSIKRLVSRMRQADFKYLSPQIQGNYAQKVDIHQQFAAQNQMAIQRAEQGLIPTGGFMSKCDLYVPDVQNPNKSSRVELPSESLQWLLSQIQAQKSGLAPLADMNQGAQAQVANKVSGPQSQQQQQFLPSNGM